MVTINISDGLNLHLISTNKFKTNMACLLIRRPLDRKEAAINALIARILGRGCAKYPEYSKLVSQTEQMYGSNLDIQIIKKGEEQLIQFLIEYPPAQSKHLSSKASEFANWPGVSLEEALELLKQVALRPMLQDAGFVLSVFEAEKSGLLSSILARKDDPAEYSRLRLIEEMCAPEAFAIPGYGYAEELDNLTPQACLSHYKNILKNSQLECILVSGQDIDICEKVFRKTFPGLIARKPSASAKLRPCAPLAARPPISLHEDATTSQGRLAMGYRASPPTNFYALMLANEVLGGPGISKLFRSIREERSLAYYVGSSLYRFKSILIVEAGVEPSAFTATAELVSAELRSLSSGNISDSEFSSAKQGLIKRYEALKDSQSALLDFCMSQYLLGDLSTINDTIRGIRALTPQETAAAAHSLNLSTTFTLGHI